MNIQKISKQMVAILLIAAMAFSMLPIQVLATGAVESESPAAVTVTGISQDPSVLTLTPGGTAALTAMVSPEEAAIAASSITVSQAEPELSAAAVTGITLGQDTLSVPLGGYSTLTYTILPENAANTAVSWSSSDETVATVEDGKITGLAEGTAVISVTAADGGFRASVTANVAEMSSLFGSSGETAAEYASPAEPAEVFLTVCQAGEFAKATDQSLMYQRSVTVMDTNSDGQLSLDEALAAAHGVYNNAEGYTTQWNDAYQSFCVTKLWGVETGAAGFYRNHAGTSSVDAEIIGAGDQITAYIFQDTAGWSDRYSYFAEDAKEAAAGETITVKLNCWGYDSSWNAVVNPVSNAVLGTLDLTTGEFTSLHVTTDENGQAEIRFPDAGIFYVTAKASEGDAPLVPPVCRITVEKAENSAPALTKLGYYESGEKVIDLTAANPSAALETSAEYIGLFANFDSSMYAATAGFGENTVHLKNSSGYWDTVSLKLPGFGSQTMTVTVTDTAAQQVVETYCITIHNPQPAYAEDNTLKDIAVEYYDGSYVRVPVCKADAAGNATADTAISNAHKYYTAVLPAGTAGYYLGIGKNAGSAQVQNAFDGGAWEAVTNFPERVIPESGTSIVKIRLADDKTYAEKGWNGSEHDYNAFTLWVKAEKAAEAPRLTGLQFYAGDLDAGLTPAFDAEVLEGYTVAPKPDKSSISIKATAPEGCTVTANYADKSEILSISDWDSLDGLEGTGGDIPVELVIHDPSTNLSSTYKLTLVYKQTAAPETVYVTIANGNLVLNQEAVTVTDRNSDGRLNLDEALYAAHETYYSGGAAAGYSSYTGEYGLSLGKLWGNDKGSYGYYLNHASAWSLEDPVKTGDYIDAFVYTTADWSDAYCFFHTRTASVDAGSEWELTLSAAGYDASYNPIAVPVNGAGILMDGENTSFFTGEDGKVSVTFAEAGTYIVSAASAAQTLVPPICIVTVHAVSPFSGSGTQTDPFLLSSASDLSRLDALVEDGETFAGKYFQMTEDITLNSGWDGIGYAKIEMKDTWGTTVPTATAFQPFAGNFDGKDHTLTFPNGSQPLFDCVRTAAIQNLKIKGNIADDGLIANYAQDGSNATATISNVTILSGTTIAGSGFLGGYASSSNAVTITNCHIQAGVSIGREGVSNIGGFAGDFNGTITDSTCAAAIYGKDFVGGILAGLGQSKPAEISGCTFSGKIIATGNYVGGISGAGYTGTAWGIGSAPNAGCISIQNCTVTGEITGGDYVGGILGAEPGVLQCWENGSGRIQNNVFAGTLSGSGEYVGGIIGYMKSINKFNRISGNTFQNTEWGIGGASYVDTSHASPTPVTGTTYVNSETAVPGISGMTRTAHNRTDDPLGADAEKLARCLDTEKPEEPGKPTLSSLTVSGNYKIRYNQGEPLDLTGAVFTAAWSDGTTTSPKLSEVTVTGYDAQKSGTQLLTAAYGGKTCIITVNVIAAPAATTITVTFSMLGDSVHGENGSVHTLKNGGLSTWISATQYTMNSGATVLDLLAKACSNNGASYAYSGGFVNSVTKGGVTLAAFTNGPNSGWMYTINGSYSDYNVSEQKLSNGDVVQFHYTDDYNIEYGSSSSGGGTAATQKTDVQKVMDLIKQIGAVSFTSACKQKIDAARAAYDALSSENKSKVDNYKTLTDAEQQYANFKKLDDQKQADAVDALIRKIKEPITLNSEQEIREARDAFDKLTQEQRDLVKNLQILTAAETKLAELKATDDDKEKAKKVIDLIAAIGAVTADSEENIRAAREAYNKLTDLQKALVINYDILEAAEKAFVRLGELEAFSSAYKATGDFLASQEKTIGSDWAVLGLIRSGYEAEADYCKVLMQYIRENVDENMHLHRVKSSDNSRTILVLTALGYDATDVEGINLVAGLNSMDYICKQGINGAFWALMALDSGNYPAPGGDVTREALIQTILEAQLSDGGWALSGETSEPDLTGMALQALAPYYHAGAADVVKAANMAIAYLCGIQGSDGSFCAENVPTSESAAQVIIALTALGIDPDTDARFLKNGCSVLDALLMFCVPGEGFEHILGGGVNGLATEQAYRALTAYDRFLKGKTRLYDMTDLLDKGGDVLTEEKTEEKTEQVVVMIPEEEPVPEKIGFFRWIFQTVKSWFTSK